MKKENSPTKPEKDQVEELDDDVLGAVNGGTDPFGDVPRVPNQEIDQDLRNKA